jgi:hypothetical protein
MASEVRPEPARANPAARMAALFALAVAAVVVVIVIAGSIGGPGGDGGDGRPADRTERVAPRPKGDTYVVQPGDTLSGIAADTGISVERLLQLNRDLDPQNLPSGQEIKLR